jgi:hypothetical protein
MDAHQNARDKSDDSLYGGLLKNRKRESELTDSLDFPVNCLFLQFDTDLFVRSLEDLGLLSKFQPSRRSS